MSQYYVCILSVVEGVCLNNMSAYFLWWRGYVSIICLHTFCGGGGMSQYYVCILSVVKGVCLNITYVYFL